MLADSLATDLNHQQLQAARLREYAYTILTGEHTGQFERRDYIAFTLFYRCLQTHEATESLVKQSLIDDAWILIRALVEHAVNCAYMLAVADSQTADDFADYPKYQQYTKLLDLKKTDETLLRQIFSVEEENRMRGQYMAVRARFEKRRGDAWCADNQLYKRAMRVDEKISEAMGERHCDLLWLVNTVWRHGSTYVHGTADVLAQQATPIEGGACIQRKPTAEEAAQALHSANLVIYLTLLMIDLNLGGKNTEEIKRRTAEWGGG